MHVIGDDGDGLFSWRWCHPSLKAGAVHPSDERELGRHNPAIFMPRMLAAQAVEDLVHTAPISIEARPGRIKFGPSGWKNGLVAAHGLHLVTKRLRGAILSTGRAVSGREWS